MTRSVSRIALATIGSCALAAILIARCAHDAKPSRSSGAATTGARGGHPTPGRRAYDPARLTAGGAERTDGALSPQLEERLRAAAHVATVPATTPSGAPPPLPPTGPLPPEAEARRQQALLGWQAQAQQLLDECVARPAAARRPVVLDVLFAPVASAGGWTAQQLSPMAVSVPPHELRQLWRDTDPDELQGCLDRVRALALSVPAASTAPAQVLPASREIVLVQL